MAVICTARSSKYEKEYEREEKDDESNERDVHSREFYS